MPVFISIGCACNVKYQIDKYIGVKETLFFDRLLTDMKSVNSILGCKNIEDIFYPENIIKIGVKGLNSRIKIKSLTKCEFIHDLPIEYCERDVSEFIEKYTRRRNRIIDYINNTEYIFFIRWGKIEKQDKDKFLETIILINPAVKFCLVSINIDQKTDCIIKENNYIEINTTETNTNKDDWTTSYINWGKIFTFLKELA